MGYPPQALIGLKKSPREFFTCPVLYIVRCYCCIYVDFVSYQVVRCEKFMESIISIWIKKKNGNDGNSNDIKRWIAEKCLRSEPVLEG